MNNTYKSALVLLTIAAIGGSSCTKTPEVGILNTGNYTDTEAPLKDATNDFPIGTAVNYTPLTAEPKFAEITKRDFDIVTFGYEMKHGAVVKDNGTFDFTRPDAMVAALGNVSIFGHTLVWHQNQNATYLKNFSGITVPAAVENLGNPGFENGLTGWSTFNTGNPAGTTTVTSTAATGEVRTGTSAMKINNPIGYPGSQWRVQIASILVPTVPGKQYMFSYWARAASAGGIIRLSTQDENNGNAQYQGNQTIGTTYAQISWTITANSNQTRFLFDAGESANTFYIDDASFKEVIVPPGGPAIVAKLDIAMADFINTLVGRYKNKVKAWDVVNEPFADNPVAIRDNGNTTTTGSDVLVWSNYLGRDFALKAFNLAKAADPTADLYINEYNLETNGAKLDSLIKYVAELKGKGAKIDGIGTQMHIGRTNMSYAGIDNMFRKLAATGLKIRVSELDVKVMQSSSATALTPELAGYQAQMYEYVVKSYIKYIPAAQRAGITIWGINDKNSWLYNSGKEFPLLYDNDYNKKKAYGGVLKALKGQ
ncbi:endo-1,4-beta-xylanase [Paraflavitalea sp. CAU 1676]|uniref:endo-1,4-beta-xylanase n=1 Tax=Paraflavitalea sp. CAU 1676 TaxID=3032598 RepID=UPI0023DB7BBF|nr:endo-1,4-beta-xylanase [Paraflavitalea sp. CAU 1676]MDF2192292.1 endo-1,4-beta-xylanase [Paraflavitalea sp. CAU 1676]